MPKAPGIEHQKLRQQIASQEEQINRLQQELKALQAEQSRLQDIYNSISDQITIVDKKGRIQDINFPYPGFTREIVTGQTFYQFAPKSMTKPLKEAFLQVLDGASESRIDGEIMTPSGYRMWLRTTMKPIFHNGKLKQVILLTQDLTALKEKEDVAALLEFVFQATNDQISLLDKDGRIRRINFPLPGLSEAEVLDVPFVGLFGDDQQAELVKGLQVIRDGQRFFRSVITYRDPDRQEYWIQLTMSPVRLRKQLAYILVVAQNITALKETEQELRQLSRHLEQEVNLRSRELALSHLELQKMDKNLDVFLHGVKHDLRSPLSLAKELILFVDEVRTDEQKNDAKKRILLNLDRVESTIADLVELIEHHTNLSDLAVETDVADLLDLVLRQFQFDIDHCHARVMIQKSGRMTFRYIPAYLRSIFYNLISNALKYQSESRRLQIQVNLQGGNPFVIRVKDNGIGIDLAKYQDALFKPNRRFTDIAEGAGLGLSILKTLIERNRGQIRLKSEYGQGTEVMITLEAL